MTWTNHNNDKSIYMFNLDILGHLETFFVDKYQGIDFVISKTNKAARISVDTIGSRSNATITINTPQKIIFLPNIDLQYTNEVTKQFAFIAKSTTYKNKKELVTNDKQLMMKTIKKIINKRITRIEQFRRDTIRQNSTLTITYIVLYDNTIEKLYRIYKAINEKIKLL